MTFSRMKYEYWQAKNRVWCWHLKAADGQVVAQGEGYVDKPDVLRAIDVARRARPADGDVRQSRRYRLSFAALLAVVVAAGCFWVAAAAVLPRWDGSLVTVDAAVVSTASHGSGKRRTTYTQVRFATQWYNVRDEANRIVSVIVPGAKVVAPVITQPKSAKGYGGPSKPHSQT